MMTILDVIKGRKINKTPIYDDAYWKARYEEELKDKNIVTAFVACFGKGHYDNFCGVQKIKGYYDKTYPPLDHSKSTEENFIKNVDAFYQIYPNGERVQWVHPVKFVFETKELAQDFYDKNVHLYTGPLQDSINALNSAKSKES